MFVAEAENGHQTNVLTPIHATVQFQEGNFGKMRGKLGAKILEEFLIAKHQIYGEHCSRRGTKAETPDC